MEKSEKTIDSIVQTAPVDVSARDVQHLRELVMAEVRRMEAAREAGDNAALAQIKNNRAVCDERNDQHARDLTAMDKASTLAKAAVDAKLEGMNELRAQINSERGSFVQREVFDATVAEWAKWRDTMNAEHARLLRREVFETTITEWTKWRDGINLGQTRFLTEDDYDRNHNQLKDRVTTIESSMANFQGRLWMLGAVISGVVILVNVAVRWWR